MQPKILFIGRGLPSGGHVSTCWSIGKALQRSFPCSVSFVSYGAGSAFLRFSGASCLDLPEPISAVFTHRTFPGWELFELQDYLDPVMLDLQPDLVVCDGELYVPTYCKTRGIPCISIASPNYISLDFGPYKQYATLIAQLLNHSTLILGYAARDCEPSPLLDKSLHTPISTWFTMPSTGWPPCTSSTTSTIFTIPGLPSGPCRSCSLPGYHWTAPHPGQHL